MRGADIEEVWWSAREALPFDRVPALAALGVPMLALELGLLGRARGVIEGRRWWPSPDGAELWASAVRVGPFGDPDAAIPSSAFAFGEIVDIVAWAPDRPDAWALMAGAATFLGCTGPAEGPEAAPVRVHRTPRKWLLSGADGLCPLVESPTELRQLLCEFELGIVVDDVAFGRELETALARPLRAPPILVATTARSAA